MLSISSIILIIIQKYNELKTKKLKKLKIIKKKLKKLKIIKKN